MRTLLSAEPVYRVWPSDEKRTTRTQSVWPFKVRIGLPSETRHSRTLTSSEPEASVWPSGENATL
jgi:hypothetical protein